MTSRIVATAFGGPEVLAFVDVAVPAPGPGEVTIEVRAAGVNPIDFKKYSGRFGTDPALLESGIGLELSGVVTAVGPDAQGQAGPLSAGDEVIAYSVEGAYAEAVTVSARQVVPKPAELSWAEAAGLFITGITAVHGLTVIGAGRGDTLLVHGASGGVGQIAVQLAVADGVTVIGTAAERHHELLRGYGALPIVYGPGLADRVRALGPGKVDAAFDAAGTDEAVDASLELVADRTRIVSIVAFGRGDTGIRLIGSGPGADPGTDIRADAWRKLLPAAAAGTIHVAVARTFPLRDAAQAHRYAIDGHPGGKIVLLA